MDQEAEDLVSVSFVKYDSMGIEQDKKVNVRMTQQQSAMLSMVEDISDVLAKSAQKKASRHAMNIAFFDVSNMSPAT